MQLTGFYCQAGKRQNVSPDPEDFAVNTWEDAEVIP
jgi:hypothetical protein